MRAAALCAHCGQTVLSDPATHVCTLEDVQRMQRENRRAQFKALIDTAEISNADICSIAGRTREGDLLFFAIYATGEAARDLEFFMQSQAEEVTYSGKEEDGGEEKAGETDRA